MKTTLAALLLLPWLVVSTAANTFFVTKTDDTGGGFCDFFCTLREAIDTANANPGADTIAFNIPGAGVHTITPLTPLPDITEAVTIDGYTQTGASENTLQVGSNAVLLIELDGTNLTFDGLKILTDSCTIRGLVINRVFFANLTLDGADNNTVEGNFIGTDPSGTVALATVDGVVVTNGSENNVIGGVTPAARNIIAGHRNGGVTIVGASNDNTILGNYIGTTKNGTASLGNRLGVEIVLNSTGNVVGGIAVGAGNLISGNTESGVQIRTFDGTPTSPNNSVQGNLIGTDATGSVALPNESDGVVIDGEDGNLIGGATAGARNLISGNTVNGVHLLAGAAGNTVQGNYVGLNALGTAGMGNGQNGIIMDDSPGNTIGGTTAGARNVISGNAENGISLVSGAADNTVQGNYIGIDALGASVIANGNGIFINEAPGNTIGGSVAGSANVISGNLYGMQVAGSGAAGNQIQGNRIGTDPTGVLPLPNSSFGIIIGGVSDLTLGGSGGAGNTIAFNGGDGVIIGIDAIGVHISGNSFFGNTDLGINLAGGVEDANNVTANDVGDADAGANNLQNYPVINEIEVAGASRSVEGQLNSAANTDYVLDFYRSSDVDPSGFGEGETYLGALDVHTSALGEANFSFPLESDAAGQFITATATDPDGNTSEFSKASEAVPAIGRFLNVSTRLRIQTGDNVLIGGFIITGTTAADVLLRGIGPSLGDFGVEDFLANPTLELHSFDGSVITNNNWRETQEAEIMATGLAPNDNLESAILATLEPGAYTAIVSGVNGGTGIGLVEAYDLSATDAERFANVSTRGLVETGDNVMIGGVILGSNTGMMARVVVRAIGPSLTDAGVVGALQDTRLELFDSNGILIQANDNWKDSQQAEIEAAGLAPSDDRESAIVRVLAPGAYTAIVRGVGDTTGVGLVEAYEIQ